MNVFLNIAWRNVWRNTRRTIITLSSISLGLMSCIMMFAIADGGHNSMANDATNTFTGHLQIHLNDYLKDNDVGINFDEKKENVLSILNSTEGIRSYTERVRGRGVLSSSYGSESVKIVGVNPKLESSTMELPKSITKGDFDFKTVKNKTKGIVIGNKLAENLEVEIGHKIVLMVQTAQGNLNNVLFQIDGIYESGSEEHDTYFAFLNINEAQNILELDGKVHEIAITLYESDMLEEVTKKLRESPNLAGFEVSTWKELLPLLSQIFAIDDKFTFAVIFTVLLTAGFGIFNTIQMSVMEKVREIGIIMAIGTKPKQVVRIVVTEAAVTGIIGIIIGTVISSTLIFILNKNGIDLRGFQGAESGFTLSMGGVSINPILRPQIEFGHYLLCVILVISTTLIAALQPAVFASRLKPIKAINQN